MTDPRDAFVAAGRPPLQPPAYPTLLAQPTVAAAPVPAPTAPTGPSLPPMPRRRGRGAAIVVLVSVGVLLLAILLAYFQAALGAGASISGMLLALLPLVAVLFALRWVDRWEPEPIWLRVLAVGWGAIVAVALALGVDLLLAVTVGTDGGAEVLSSVVQAPVVEEISKGLGVLVILAVGRRAFDGPVDGIVYGGLIGAGFAFTENIQYFGIAIIEGGIPQASTVFFLRGILSPFAHVMFTAVTGLAVGLAARRGARVGRAFAPWLGGVAGAIVLHALWNGSAVFGDFFGLYLTLQVPLFLLFIGGVLALRAEEARVTRARLGEYAAAGWFTAEEVRMLATAAGRRDGLHWARSQGGDRRSRMRTFILESTRLAAMRQRVLAGRDPVDGADERALLARTVAARQALFTG